MKRIEPTRSMYAVADLYRRGIKIEDIAKRFNTTQADVLDILQLMAAFATAEATAHGNEMAR